MVFRRGFKLVILSLAKDRVFLKVVGIVRLSLRMIKGLYRGTETHTLVLSEPSVYDTGALNCMKNLQSALLAFSL
jgi:hypothetical protein